MTVTTLLVIGQRDRTAFAGPWVSDSVRATLGNYPVLGRAAALAFRHAELVEIAGVGHLPQVEAFDQYSAALLEIPHLRREPLGVGDAAGGSADFAPMHGSTRPRPGLCTPCRTPCTTGQESPPSISYVVLRLPSRGPSPVVGSSSASRQSSMVAGPDGLCQVSGPATAFSSPSDQGPA